MTPHMDWYASRWLQCVKKLRWMQPMARTFTKPIKDAFNEKKKQKEKRTGKKKDTYASTYYASLVCTSP